MSTKIKQQDIASFLEKEIIENEIANGVKLPSATQLAKKYNVSSKTADRALSLLVKKNLIYRKRGCGNFVKNNRPAWKSLYVALFCNALQSPQGDDLTHMFTKLVCQKLKEHSIKYDIFVEHLQKGTILNKEEFYKYDALIMPAGAALLAKDELSKYDSDIIIFADDIVHMGNWHQIVFDYMPGFKKALEYCLGKHKRKFFVPIGNTTIFERRTNAFLDAAKSLGINSKDIVVFNANIEDELAASLVGEMGAKYFIENKLNDHVIITTSDFATYGMMKVFKENSYIQNRDFFLISYDNLSEYLEGEKLNLDVNSITHPLQEHADALCVMLESITRKKTNYFQAYFTAATNLVIRHEF